MSGTYSISLTDYMIYHRLTRPLSIFDQRPSRIERIVARTVVNQFPETIINQSKFYEFRRRIIVGSRFDTII